MQTIKAKTLGMEFNLSVPSTPEEFDILAKAPGACLAEATKNVLYRSTLSDIRDALCEKVEEFTKIERATKPGPVKKDGSAGAEQWAETEEVYINRVLASRGFDSIEKDEELKAIFDEVVAATPFDPSAPVRSSKPKTTAKIYLTAAENIIAAGGAEKAAAKLSELLGHAVGTSKEELAAAIREDKARKEKELANEYLA